MERDRRYRGYTTVARIVPGASIDQVRAEVAALATRLTGQYQ
jgi:hypothetical protein